MFPTVNINTEHIKSYNNNKKMNKYEKKIVIVAISCRNRGEEKLQ